MRLRTCLALTVAIGLPVARVAAAEPAKVFILAGQSNMQGYGHIRTIDWLGEDPQHGAMLKRIKKADGSFVERDDVWVWYNRGPNQVKKGNLTVGYGANNDHIGPELMFGHAMGDHFDSQVLLIKTAWGGRNLAINFRPPSAGDPPLATYPEEQRLNLEEGIKNKTVQVGKEYREMVAEVKDVLANLDKHFPASKGQGHEIAGFVWFQGWNDMINADFTAEYGKNLEHLIRDLRKDLGLPKLPVVVAAMGVGGARPSDKVVKFRKAQAAGTAAAEFKGNVALVETAPFWDEKAQAILDKGWIGNKWVDENLKKQFDKMGNQPPYHYLGSARIHALMGNGMAEAMKGLLQK